MENRVYAAFSHIHADEELVAKTFYYILNYKRRKNALVLRAAAALLLFIIQGSFLYFTAAAHINIEVNPSVELTLNRFDRVISTHAYNEDGAKVLEGISLFGKKYNYASALLLSAMEGYISDDTFVSVTVQSANAQKEQIMCDTLMNDVYGSFAEANSEVYSVTEEVWNAAHACHMSPARYLMIEELLETDDTAAFEDYSGMSTGQIRQCLRQHHGGHGDTDGNSNGNGGGNGNGNGHHGGH